MWTHLPQEVHMDMAQKKSNMPNVSFATKIASIHNIQPACVIDWFEAPMREISAFQTQSISLLTQSIIFAYS